MSGYLRKFAYEETKRRNVTMWTCAHCKTGIVRSLPARCPECDKYLTEAVVTETQSIEEWKGKESRK